MDHKNSISSHQDKPTTIRVSKRVAVEIRRQEKSTEILIGWVQLSIVAFFGLLYAFAPRAEGTEGFNFVPYALTAYMIFTVIRLAVSYQTLAPAWFLILSIMIDVALLFGIIFSFHIQYGQHPTFYLKASTIMYIFLFVALRALRFDPRFVVVSGLAAVLGWLVLVGYAVFSDMERMRFTRNYVEYMTSNAILIGAEVDKIIIIVGVTAILTVALMRGRRLLMEAVRSAAAASDLSRFFPPEVAASITDADEALKAGEGVAREAAVLFVDVRGFTRFTAEMAPEEVMDLLRRYQSQVVPKIQEAGGRIDKFLGDGILATFGAVAASDTYAADALRSIESVLAAGDACNDELKDAGIDASITIGCAVAAGRVIVGVVGAQGRLEFTVIGDTVNLAAKLEDANKIENTRALTTRETYRLALSQGFSAGRPPEVRPGRKVAGVAGLVDLVVFDHAVRAGKLKRD